MVGWQWHQLYCNRFKFILKCLWSYSALTLLVGSRKGIQPVKTEWCGTGMVVCLEQGENPEWFTFLVPDCPGCPGKRPLIGCNSSSLWYYLLKLVPCGTDGRFLLSGFQAGVTLTLDLVIRIPSCISHRPLSTPNFTEIGKTSLWSG